MPPGVTGSELVCPSTLSWLGSAGQGRGHGVQDGLALPAQVGLLGPEQHLVGHDVHDQALLR